AYTSWPSSGRKRWSPSPRPPGFCLAPSSSNRDTLLRPEPHAIAREVGMAERGNVTYDPNFKYDVAAQPGGEQIKVCFSCGTCTAGCPVTDVDERYSPRRIIRQILLGQR